MLRLICVSTQKLVEFKCLKQQKKVKSEQNVFAAPLFMPWGKALTDLL